MSTRWGIAGTGGIADRFASDLSLVDEAELVAVASRSSERAHAFADRYGIARRHADYADLAADPGVDIVYVATPSARHEADSLLFLEAGKNVLCEKPFALNAGQARRMVAAARHGGLFLMDAMWSRFLPSYRALTDLIGEGRIGDPLLGEADFCFRVPVDPAHRLFDPALGGGALVDLGVYPLQLASLVLGTPDRIAAVGVIGSTGVDEQVAAVLHHPGGTIGVVKAAIRVPMTCGARIAGTDGWIELSPFMHHTSSLRVINTAGRQDLDLGWDGDGIRFQVLEVQRCLNAGLLESPVMPLAETVTIVETMDEIRRQIGFAYPDERTGDNR
jgi:predicted dehydrogenase